MSRTTSFCGEVVVGTAGCVVAVAVLVVVDVAPDEPDTPVVVVVVVLGTVVVVGAPNFKKSASTSPA